MNRWQKVAEAAEQGNLAYLKEAQTYQYVNFTWNTEALFRAVDNNHMDCVEFLLPLSDLRVERGEIVNGSTGQLLQTAVRNNNFEMVVLLLPHCNPQVDNSLALQWASQCCDMNMVELLYPLSNPIQALRDLYERIHIGVWMPDAATLLEARMQRDTLVSHLPTIERTTVRKL